MEVFNQTHNILPKKALLLVKMEIIAIIGKGMILY